MENWEREWIEQPLIRQLGFPVSVTAPRVSESSLKVHLSSAGPSPANISGEIKNGDH